MSFFETSFDKKQVLNNPTPKHTAPPKSVTIDDAQRYAPEASRFLGEVFSTMPQKSDFSKKPMDFTGVIIWHHPNKAL